MISGKRDRKRGQIFLAVDRGVSHGNYVFVVKQQRGISPVENAGNGTPAYPNRRRIQVNRYSVWQLTIVSALLVAGPAIAGGDVEAGQAKASTCAGCHGVNGEGMGENPPIAGLDNEAFVTSMQSYKSGENPEPMMGMIMQTLSDEDIVDLAAYYASLSTAE